MERVEWRAWRAIEDSMQARIHYIEKAVEDWREDSSDDIEGA